MADRCGSCSYFRPGPTDDDGNRSGLCTLDPPRPVVTEVKQDGQNLELKYTAMYPQIPSMCMACSFFAPNLAHDMN